MRLKVFFYIGLAGLLAVISGVSAGFIHLYLTDLPQIKYLEDYQPSATTRILDNKGRLIGELFQEKREPIRLSEVSQDLVQAILAVEDERFYHHVGVDIKGILRALLANIREQSFVQGGSTITQQLTRGLFLTTDKTIARKIKEAVLAVQIENRYSKEEILELYCNQIYLGSGVYGVEAAARKYFNRSAADLELHQAALIAGLPRAPSYYDPLKYPKRALQRRSTVLKRMLTLGLINPRSFQEAKLAPLDLVPQESTSEAPYFVEAVRQYLEDKYGYTAVYQKGLEVYTTLDLDIQKLAEESLRQGLESLDQEAGWRSLEARDDEDSQEPRIDLKDLAKGMIIPAVVADVRSHLMTLRIGRWFGTVRADGDRWPYITDFTGHFNEGDAIRVKINDTPPLSEPVGLSLVQDPLIQGALVCLNPRNGHLLAMVGGYDFSVSQFNRVTQARRQPGSAIKPFIYAAAVESGFSPADLILDAPISYWDPIRKIHWEPSNFSNKFYGETTLVEGLTHSRNVVTIKLLSRLGVGKFIRFMRRLGITGPMEPNLTLALGTFSITPLELAGAYSVLSNGGIRVSPMMIDEVLDTGHRIIEDNQPTYEKVLDPAVSFVTLEMMRSVINHGTGRIARRLGYPVAGKTGTTNNYQDAWFVGFSPMVVTAVWVGYDDNCSLGRMGTGSTAAGPIWVSFMEDLKNIFPAQDFQAPDGVIYRSIDPATGLLAGEDCPEQRLVAFLKGSEPKEYCSHSRDKVPIKLRFDFN